MYAKYCIPFVALNLLTISSCNNHTPTIAKALPQSTAEGNPTLPPMKDEVRKKLLEVKARNPWFQVIDTDRFYELIQKGSKEFKKVCIPDNDTYQFNEALNYAEKTYTVPSEIEDMKTQFNLRFIACGSAINSYCADMEEIDGDLVYTYKTVNGKSRSVTKSDIKKDVREWISSGMSKGDTLKHAKIADQIELCEIGLKHYRVVRKSEE